MFFFKWFSSLQKGKEKETERDRERETDRDTESDICKEMYDTLNNFNRLATEGYTPFISVVSRRERAVLSYYTITGKPFIIIYMYI